MNAGTAESVCCEAELDQLPPDPHSEHGSWHRDAAFSPEPSTLPVLRVGNGRHALDEGRKRCRDRAFETRPDRVPRSGVAGRVIRTRWIMSSCPLSEQLPALQVDKLVLEAQTNEPLGSLGYEPSSGFEREDLEGRGRSCPRRVRCRWRPRPLVHRAGRDRSPGSSSANPRRRSTAPKPAPERHRPVPSARTPTSRTADRRSAKSLTPSTADAVESDTGGKLVKFAPVHWHRLHTGTASVPARAQSGEHQGYRIASNGASRTSSGWFCL